MSDISDILAKISEKTTEELKELCNAKDDQYDQFVIENDSVKRLEAEREMQMASVRSLAEFSLARRSDYETDRASLTELVGECKKIKESIESKANEMLKLSKRTSLESTLAILQEAMKEADDESELMAKQFLDKEIDHDTFISKYSDTRKLAYLRRIKADRLRQENPSSWSS